MIRTLTNLGSQINTDARILLTAKWLIDNSPPMPIRDVVSLRVVLAFCTFCKCINESISPILVKMISKWKIIRMTVECSLWDAHAHGNLVIGVILMELITKFVSFG